MVTRKFEAFCLDDDDVCYFNLLPDEMCLQIMLNLHPIYDDVITISTVCKKWRRFLVWNADPTFWEHIHVHNIRFNGTNGSYDIILKSFRRVLSLVGQYVKIIDIFMCNTQFAKAIFDYSSNLNNLRSLKIVRTKWDKQLLRQLCCRNTLIELSIDASDLQESQLFDKNDFVCTIDDFPNLKTFGLQYHYFHSRALQILREVILSSHGQSITHLSFKPTHIYYNELHYIVSRLKNLKSLTYGNDGVIGINNPCSRCILESTSLERIEFMNVSNLKELRLYTTSLQKILVKACTFLIIIKLNSETLESLSLFSCSNLRNLDSVSAPSLKEFKFRFCRQVPSSNFLKFLERHRSITHLVVQPHWSLFHLIHSCCYSLKELHVLCSSDVLTSVNITAPNMTKFHCIKSSGKYMNIKEIKLIATSLFRVALQGVPKLANINIIADHLGTLEIDFGGQELSKNKEPCFIKFSGKLCRSLEIKRCNLQFVRFPECKMKFLFLDNCILNVGANICFKGCVEQILLRNCTGKV